MSCRRRPSLCSPLLELASFTWRCHGNPSLTPCEQSHRISPERQLKCQHCSRHCHVGLGEKGVGGVVVGEGAGGARCTCDEWLCNCVIMSSTCVCPPRGSSRLVQRLWREGARWLKWKRGVDMDLDRTCKQSCVADYVAEKKKFNRFTVIYKVMTKTCICLNSTRYKVPGLFFFL